MNEKIADSTIPARIDSLLNNGLVNEWETNFLNSIKGSYERFKSLTMGQNNTFLSIEKRYTAEELAARQSWRDSWNSEKAEIWKSLMEYYLTTPYFRGATDRYKKNPEWIPGEADYKAVCENKYALRYVKNRSIPPKFRDGQLAVYKRYGTYYLATIVSTGDVYDWTKGSRKYTILLVGEASPLTVAEKELLYYRDGLIPKIQKADDDVPF